MAYFDFHPGPRTTRPGVAPVCSPFFRDLDAVDEDVDHAGAEKSGPLAAEQIPLRSASGGVLVKPARS